MKVSGKGSEVASGILTPPGAEPKHIGCVVTVQLFNRSVTGSDEISAETLVKYVGVLEAYTQGVALGTKTPSFEFYIRGIGRREVNLRTHYVEIILR